MRSFFGNYKSSLLLYEKPKPTTAGSTCTNAMKADKKERTSERDD